MSCVTGDVKPGLPQLSPPPFSATVGNHTYTFVEMTSTLGSAIFVVPLLSILENIALAKVFCKSCSQNKYIYYINYCKTQSYLVGTGTAAQRQVVLQYACLTA